MAAKKNRLAFRVLVGPWSADGDTYHDRGIVEMDDAPASLVRLASHAHAAGILDVTEGLDLSTAESQEDSEAALMVAQDEGRWQEGNLIQNEIDEGNGVAP